MKLEPGCLAVIIYGPNSGTMVECIEFVGRDRSTPKYDDLWHIDKEITWRMCATGFPVEYPYCPARYMIRKPDPEELEEMEKEDAVHLPTVS